ncbi:MAG: phosphoheptose isomerase [Gammaproteobacteria bacterium]|nr:phosphoheptose isomerase [Gammaproteobacteria bacterium]|tara:strand:+ start:33943 stop:34533 length:591 start_codon:yes stop_codon:yes gene_type:complete
MDKLEIIKSNFYQNRDVIEKTVNTNIEDINYATDMLINMIESNGKLLVCGNGGSSGDAQHISSEFINRFEKERTEMPAISLNSDTATLTSIANDYDYKYIFSKQVKALGQPNDILMTFTTSGNSNNINEAIIAAKERNIKIILISGKDGGKAATLLGEQDCKVIIPHDRTSRIQEMHLIIIHSICECLDEYMTSKF